MPVPPPAPLDHICIAWTTRKTRIAIQDMIRAIPDGLLPLAIHDQALSFERLPPPLPPWWVSVPGYPDIENSPETRVDSPPMPCVFFEWVLRHGTTRLCVLLHQILNIKNCGNKSCLQKKKISQEKLNGWKWNQEKNTLF